MVVRRSDTRTPINSHLKTNIPTESWEQIAQDRTKWRGLIRRGAGEYEAKRISKTEQKHAQQNARAKVSPLELSSLRPLLCYLQQAIWSEDWSYQPSQNTQIITPRILLGLVIVSNDRRTIINRRRATRRRKKSHQ